MYVFKAPGTVTRLGLFSNVRQSLIARRNIATMPPPLWRRLEDGTEVAVTEEDIYKYQRYRWLSGESERLAIRYRKFNLQALIDIATNVKGNSGRSCIKVLKCVEGQFNKVFILTMDDGDEVVVKIPNPNAGPSFYMLASEVATRQFLSSVLGVPVPHIYTWSSDASNPVGAEYIIEEKAGGQQLGSVWFQWSKDLQLDLVKQIYEMETKFASFSFSRHGSIYYKADLESRGITHEPLDSSIARMTPSAIKTLPEIFAIGPSTDPRLWTDKRATMDLHRGPWTSPVDYIKGIGLNEIQWARSYAKPRMNFHRSTEHPETPDDYISLLQQYIKLAPVLAMGFPEDGCIQTISHQDLHLDNIFVDPKTKSISSIIDWQSTSISPRFLQRMFPQFLEPLNDSTPSPDDLLTHYQGLRRRDVAGRTIIDDRYISIKTKPIHLVPSCWDREDLFSLRNALISVIAHWKDIAPDAGPCPIMFTEEELLLHQNEMELLEGLSSIMHQLQDEAMIPLGGMVRPSDYERLKELNKQCLKDFVDLGEDAGQKALHAKVWPYPDTA